jgi:hypothetical protein
VSPAAIHRQDSDCAPFIDQETGCCSVCDVDHFGAPCRECKQRGFHLPGCPEMAEIASEDRALGAIDHAFEAAGDR